MLRLGLSMIGSPINLIAKLLINWIAMCMYSQIEYSSMSHLKFISNGLNGRKNIGPTSLNIYNHDNGYVKNLIFVVALRKRYILIIEGS